MLLNQLLGRRVGGDVNAKRIAQVWSLRVPALLGLCLLMSACGGGGSGSPVPFTNMEMDQIDTYLEHTESVWTRFGSLGLDAFIDGLEDEANAVRYEFEQVRNSILASREFENVFGRGRHARDSVSHYLPFPYVLMKLDYAWAAGLTGEGQTIAIHDTAYNFDSRHFENSNIDCGDNPGEFGACGPPAGLDDQHGTHVAGVIVADLDNSDLVGVAPDAKLIAYSWHGGFNHGPALESATSAGAVAFNQSWGWGALNLEDQDSVDNLIANSSQRIEQMDEFQSVGVLVWTKSNEYEGSGPTDERYFDNPADWPLLFPELEEAWISVANAYFELDRETHEIFYADLYSTPCGHSGPWCVTGSGLLMLAGVDGSEVEATNGSRSSWVAPQVSGAIALIAQAYPDLSPADWTARLLATANNSWFLNPGDPGYNDEFELGERCWNEGADNQFCHTYSWEFGHGLIDLEAALKPVGNLYVVSGAGLSMANRATLEMATLTVPLGSFGALQDSLTLPLTTFDALNGNFTINTTDLLYKEDQTSAAASLLRRFEYADDAKPILNSLGGYSLSTTTQVTKEGLPSEFNLQRISSKTGVHLGFGFTSIDATANFGGLSNGNAINSIGFTGLLGDTVYASLGLAAGGGHGDGGGGLSAIRASELTLFGFTAENANNSDGSISGLGARYGVHFDHTQFEISASLAAEQGSYLGISGDKDIWFGGTASLAAGQIVLRHDLGEGLNFTARAELGSLSGGADDGKVSLISQMDDTLYSGFEVALKQQDMFTGGDQLALWVSQPMRVEKSGMTLTLASGRTKEGDILYTDYRADLTPEERQIDVGVSYNFLSSDGFAKTQLGVMQSFNLGHVAGEAATSVALRHVMWF
ncbi:MAG: S8 family serine peptidase [Rhizobiaceae bacterium]